MQGTFDLTISGPKEDIKNLLAYVATTNYAYLFEDPIKWGMLPADFDQLPGDAQTRLHDATETSGNLWGMVEWLQECVKRFPVLEVDYRETYDTLINFYCSKAGSSELKFVTSELDRPPRDYDDGGFYWGDGGSVDGGPIEYYLHIPNGVTEIRCEDICDLEAPGSCDDCDVFSVDVTIPERIQAIEERAFEEMGAIIDTITILSDTVIIGDDAFPYGEYTVIRGHAGSIAEKYAKEYGITFEVLK